MRTVVVLVVAGLAALGACGDDDDDVAADATTTTTVAQTSTTTASPAVTALGSYVTDVLRWPDTEVAEVDDGFFEVTSATYGTATAAMIQDVDGRWQVESLSTPPLGSEEESYASVKLGYGEDDSVELGGVDPALTPELTISYGDGLEEVFSATGELGGTASWKPVLDPSLDTGPRRLAVMWRDADGVAIAASVLPIPAGPFAAG